MAVDQVNDSTDAVHSPTLACSLTIRRKQFDKVFPSHEVIVGVVGGHHSKGAESGAQALEAFPEHRPVVQVQLHELLKVYLCRWRLEVHLVFRFD